MTAAPEPTANLLRRFGAGDAPAQAELVVRVGRELKELAEAHFRRVRGDGLLQPTMLVNEVWLRLAEREGLDFDNRRMFLGFASRVMRNLLVDEARAAVARGQGAASQRVSLSEAPAAASAEDDAVELLDLDVALRELEARDPESARLVELRFFGGLELTDIAATLGLSESTVDRRLRFARAWLRARLAR